MNFELTLFIFLYFFLIFNIHVKYHIAIKNYLTFLLLLAYIVAVRYTNLDGDMSVYFDSVGQSRFDLYYLKEILFWLLIDFSTFFTKSELLFVVSDLVVLILISRILFQKQISFYMAPLFFILFFFFLGHQNVYRQWIATLLVIYFIQHKSLMSFIAILFHNSTAITLYAFYVSLLSKYRILMLAAFAVFLFMLSLVPKGYADVNTGSNLVLPLAGLSLLYISVTYVFDSRFKQLCWFLFLFWCFAMLSSSALSSTYIERIFYMLLGICTPYLLVSLLKFKYRIFLSIFITLNFIPTFLTGIKVFII